MIEGKENDGRPHAEIHAGDGHEPYFEDTSRTIQGQPSLNVCAHTDRQLYSQAHVSARFTFVASMGGGETLGERVQIECTDVDKITNRAKSSVTSESVALQNHLDRCPSV